MAFHLRLIWLQTLVAFDSESRLTSFPSFARRHLKSLRCLSRRLFKFVGQDGNLDLLLCTGFDSEHVTCCFVPMSYLYPEGQRPMNDRKIERSDGCLSSNNFSPIPSKNFISHEKKVLVAARNLQIVEIVTVLTLELSQYC